MRGTDLKSNLSVCIPTYGRNQVLIDTICQFLEQEPAANEILVIDQTALHTDKAEISLNKLEGAGKIRWIRLNFASQPGALNTGLNHATQPIVLFVDDDIRIDRHFVGNHEKCYQDKNVWAVAGQVLQPEQEVLTGWRHRSQSGPFADWDFPFHSDRRCFIENGMSGNLSVRRAKALAIGGFDENFLPPVSYRFDNEFCKRLCRAGGKILFEPEARIYHLRHVRGGTRSRGNHMASASPLHGVGDYYFALRQRLSRETLLYMARRPFREIRTRFHMKNPWWIPVKFFGEIRALALAIRLYRRGPRLLKRGQRTEV